MEKINKEFNVQTGEETITNREETQDEITARLEWEAELQARQEAEALKQAQKAELLAKLGITEEEAKLLLS